MRWRIRTAGALSYTLDEKVGVNADRRDWPIAARRWPIAEAGDEADFLAESRDWTRALYLSENLLLLVKGLS